MRQIRFTKQEKKHLKQSVKRFGSAFEKVREEFIQGEISANRATLRGKGLTEDEILQVEQTMVEFNMPDYAQAYMVWLVSRLDVKL